MNKFCLSMLLFISLTACAGPVSVPTPTVIVCPIEEVKQYKAQIDQLMVEFDDSIAVANNTARIALAPIVSNMQATRRAVTNLDVPPCALDSKLAVLNWMNAVVDAFIAFMGEKPDAEVGLLMSEADETLEIALKALADVEALIRPGEVGISRAQISPTPRFSPSPTSTPTITPTPRPTSTPRPTNTPTPIPLGAPGNPASVNEPAKTSCLTGEEISIRVIEIIRGPNAHERISAVNFGVLPEPAPGGEYILIYIQFSYDSGPSGRRVWIDRWNFAIFTVDEELLLPSPFISPAPELDATLFAGTATEGWIFFEIPIAETHPFLVFALELEEPELCNLWFLLE